MDLSNQGAAGGSRTRARLRLAIAPQPVGGRAAIARHSRHEQYTTRCSSSTQVRSGTPTRAADLISKRPAGSRPRSKYTAGFAGTPVCTSITVSGWSVRRVRTSGPNTQDPCFRSARQPTLSSPNNTEPATQGPDITHRGATAICEGPCLVRTPHRRDWDHQPSGSYPANARLDHCSPRACHNLMRAHAPAPYLAVTQLPPRGRGRHPFAEHLINTSSPPAPPAWAPDHNADRCCTLPKALAPRVKSMGAACGATFFVHLDQRHHRRDNTTNTGNSTAEKNKNKKNPTAHRRRHDKTQEIAGKLRPADPTRPNVRQTNINSIDANRQSHDGTRKHNRVHEFFRLFFSFLSY